MQYVNKIFVFSKNNLYICQKFNMSKHSIQIDESLYNEISAFCKANNEKINVFCSRVLKNQLLMEKFGDTPFEIYPNHEACIIKKESEYTPTIQDSTEFHNKVYSEQPINGQPEKDTEKIEIEEIKIITPENQVVKPKKRRL